jgi:hypothetical protein
MVSALLLGSIFLAAAPSDLAAYQTAAVEAKHDPDANVRLALWCEAHGLQAEKLKHLAFAVLANPTHATARGLLGLVAYRGKWQRPDDVGNKIRSDEAMAATLAEYNGRRASMKNTAESHWKMAVWCEENGLKPEALAHLTAVVRHDPSRDAAWKRLGYKKDNNRWVTDAQLSSEKAEREAQKRANKHWQPILTKLRDRLGDPKKQDGAEKTLADLNDPRAVPAVWDVFATGNEARQIVAVQLLGQIDAGGASRALAFLSVSSESAEVRRRATETLRQRDPREFVGMLVGLVRDPIKYQVKPVNGPGSAGALFVEGKKFNVQRNYVVPPINPLSIPRRLFDSSIPFDPYSSQNVTLAMAGMMTGVRDPALQGTSGSCPPRRLAAGAPQSLFLSAEEMAAQRDIAIAQALVQAQRATNIAQQQMVNDVAAIEATNAVIRQTNDRALPVLNDVTGQDLGESADSWRKWWTDHQGYPYEVSGNASAYKPTYQQSFLSTQTSMINLQSCFGAGTPVRTLDGPRQIETIRVGDQLLTQDTKTGALSFQPVVAVFHNKPAPTFRIKLGDEAIVATGIHRFWKAGKGWTMARDLKPGDSIRTVGGTANVDSVETESVQPVFNLEVASGRSFFVGSQGMLVHDNTLAETVPHPFDASPSLASAAKGTAN